MRVIGEINHPKYKITVFQMNERLSVKIEDRLIEQIYKFRDGSGVDNVQEVEKLLTPKFMEQIDQHFLNMSKTYIDGLEAITNDEDLSFEII